MNILFVTGNYPPMDGGIAAFGHNLCRALAGQGHKVVVLANAAAGGPAFDRRSGLKTIRLSGRLRPTSLETILRTCAALTTDGIDVIFFGHFGSTHWLGGVLAGPLFKVPYFILVHGTELNGYFHRFTKVDRWASRVVLDRAAGVLVNSAATRRLVQDHGYPPDRIRVVNPGVSVHRFRSAGGTAEIKRKHGLHGKRVLLTVSRLVGKKGHRSVLKALPDALKLVPDLVYLIVGQGPEEEALRRQADELALHDRVRFAGYVEPERVVPYFRACDVFVMPSSTVDLDYESFGIAYLEANACGKPVIAGRSGGVAEAVVDGETGLLVEPDDVPALSAAIVRLLTDRPLARRLGERGKKRTEEEFGWARAGEKVIDTIMERCGRA